MGLNVGELTAILDLNDTAFNAKLSRAQGRMETVGRAMTKAAVAGAVVAGVVVAKSIKTYNDWGESIAAITRLTGMSTQAASQFAGQWKRFGIDAQSGINATKFLAKNLDSAQQGTKTMADVFKRLGVALKDSHGKLRDVADVMPEVRDKLSQMDDAGQRTALTLKLFGRGGVDMLKWLTKAPAEITKVNKELAGLGMVWGGKQIRDWHQLKDAQHEMSLQWTALQLNLAQTLLPELQKLMGFVTGLTAKWNALSDGTRGTVLKVLALVGALGLVVPKALAAAAAVKTLMTASAASGAVSAVSGAEGAAGAVGGGAASTAAAAGAGGFATTFAIVAGPLIAAGIAAYLVNKGFKPAASTQQMQASGVMNQGRMAGSAPNIAAPSLQAYSKQIQEAEDKWRGLREKLQERVAAGEFDNKGLLKRIDEAALSIQHFRELAQHKIQPGHIASEQWMSALEKATQRTNYFHSLLKQPISPMHITAEDDATAKAQQVRAYMVSLFRDPIVQHIMSSHTSGNGKGYASGGVASGSAGGFLALLHGTEAIVPLGADKRADADRVMRQAGLSGSVRGGDGGSVTLHAHLYLDGSEIADYVSDLTPDPVAATGAAAYQAARDRKAGY